MMMTSEEDKEFLLKQRQNSRLGFMLGIELKVAQAEERLLQKQRKALEIEAENWSLFTETVERTDDKTIEESEGHMKSSR